MTLNLQGPYEAALNASPTSPPFSFIHLLLINIISHNIPQHNSSFKLHVLTSLCFLTTSPDPVMTSQTKTNVDGVHSDVKVVERPTKEMPYDLLLRFLGLSLTLVATIVVGVNNETKVISYAEMHFKATAKWEYMSAMV